MVPSPGDTIGGFEIVAPLTSGGMGTVFLARRTGIGGFQRLVALKRVRDDLKNNQVAVERLLHEARLCARLDHPNVARVEELFEEDGIVYLAMEYVHGLSLSTLERRLKRLDRRVIPALAVHITARIAEALHAAHELRDDSGELGNVVHRDVSPQNVLVSQTGHIKLIDFGVARSPWRKDLTQVGRVLGKLRYMAPEQLRGEPVDRRADIFALGVVAWELLTNRSLFWVPDNIESTNQVIRPEVEPPSRWVPDIPKALDDVVMSALASNPSERPKSTIVFRRRLLRVVPEAALLDAPLLAALLAATAAEDLARERAEMPDEISSWLKLRGSASVSEGPAATRTVYELTRGSSSLDANHKSAPAPVLGISESSVDEPIAPTPGDEEAAVHSAQHANSGEIVAADDRWPATPSSVLPARPARQGSDTSEPIEVLGTPRKAPSRRTWPLAAAAAMLLGAGIAVVVTTASENESPSAEQTEERGAESRSPHRSEYAGANQPSPMRAARPRSEATISTPEPIVIEPLPPPPQLREEDRFASRDRRADRVTAAQRARLIRAREQRARRRAAESSRRARASRPAPESTARSSSGRRAVRQSSGLPLIERVDLGRGD